MARTTQAPTLRTMADILDRLGGIAPERVLMNPLPGKATEKDLLRLHAKFDKLYELVDGILVEKAMGWLESSLATRIIHILATYLDEHDLGALAGADGTVRLERRLVRMPDIAFVSWSKLPSRELPDEPIPDLIPDLAIEVLSVGNTPGEMALKRKEYFFAGVRLVWQVDPEKRTVEVFTAPDQCVVLTEKDTLDGGDVLPGFQVSIREIFLRVPRSAHKSKKTRRANKPRNGSDKQSR